MERTGSQVSCLASHENFDDRSGADNSYTASTTSTTNARSPVPINIRLHAHSPPVWPPTGSSLSPDSFGAPAPTDELVDGFPLPMHSAWMRRMRCATRRPRLCRHCLGRGGSAGVT